ncbi:MAG TPA: hypothetical protein ENN03_05085 [bacterium]|nr:hypothetical protein [bacterium]
MTGKTISHYKILEKLGEGSMGVVYKAEDTKLKRFVALKFLPPELTRDEDAKKRFIHEARAAASLEHGNICSIYEIDETEEGQTCIVMSCYEGETLKDKIGKAPLQIEEAVDITVQIALGLEQAHQKRIVHRDIKPANIFITKQGQVKILDFGLAKLAGQVKMTKTGTTLGTVSYMSPEQAKGGELDHRTDIWSLGVVLYEMLTGRLPFKGDYEQAVAYNIANECPDPVTGLRTGVPPALDRIIFKCLEKDPSKRYQHIEDLAVDLKALSDSRSGNAFQPHPARDGRKRKWLVPASGVLAVILIWLFLGPLNRFGLKPVPSPGFEKKILFIPLENLGPEEMDYFAEGVTEEIISRLASLHTLGVISRQSALHYAGKGYTTEAIGKELGVHYIFNGNPALGGCPGWAKAYAHYFPSDPRQR